MKKILVLICMVSLAGFLFSGCVFPYGPAMGYSNMKGPITSTGKAAGSRTGTATCVNYAGAYAAGDASIEAAAKDGGIRNIHTVDFEFINYSPFYSRTTTIVTGE